MNKYMKFVFPVTIAVMAIMTGCDTIYGSGYSSQSEREANNLRKEMERQQLRQDAETAKATALSVEGQLSQLYGRIEALEVQARTAAWATKSDVQVLKDENALLRSELAALKEGQAGMRKEIVSNVQGLLKEQQKRAPASKTLSGYEHKVESGQSLSKIAAAYGVSVSKIKEANSLKNDVIRVGQTLFIPD